MDGQLIQQWMKSCRLCLLDDGVKLPIFGEEGIVREVAQKIQTCFPMIVLYNADPLSKIICQRCLFMLDTVYNFRQKCVETNQVFTSHLTGLKSNSSSVKQYLLALEKNGSIPANIPAVQIPKPIHTSEPKKTQAPFNQRSSLASFRTRNVAAKLRVKPVETDPLSITNLCSSPVRIKQEVIDSSDGSSSGKSTPLIISVVGSYSDVQIEEGAAAVTEATSLSREKGLLPGTIKVKQEMQLLNPKFQSRLKTFKVITPWHCKFCNKYYKSKETQYKHGRYFCPYKSVPCKICNEIFKSENEMFEHSAKHLRVNAFLKDEDLHPCKVCSKRFATSRMLTAHTQTHSGSLLHDILQPAQSENVAAPRKKPTLRTNSVKSFRKRVFKSRYSRGCALPRIPRSYCPYCPNSYARNGKLTYHKKRNHLEEYLEELELKKEMSQQASPGPTRVEVVEPAQEVASDPEPVPPGKSNVIRTALYRPGPLSKQKPKRSVGHGLLRELLNKRILKCPICNKLLGSPVGLQNHMRSHNNGSPMGPKAHRCTLCGRLFGTKGGVNYHMATQHPEGDSCIDAFRCQPCNITFPGRAEWFMHKLSHNKGNKGNKLKRKPIPGHSGPGMAADRPKLLLCCYCNQVFSESAELKAHQLTHKVAVTSTQPVPKTAPVLKTAPTPRTGLPPRPAPAPRMAPASSQGQRQNQSGELWPCTLCTKVCSTKRNLGRHTKTHELRAHCSHHCNLCSKRFLSKAALVRHDAFTHSTAKSFRCQTCCKIFFRKGSYLNHLSTPCERPARLHESTLPTPGDAAVTVEPAAISESFPGANPLKLCLKCGFTRTVGHKCELWMDHMQTNFVKRAAPRRSYRCRVCGATFASSYSHNSHMKAHVNHRNKQQLVLKVPGILRVNSNFADVPLLEDNVVHMLQPPHQEADLPAPLDLSYVEPIADNASSLHDTPCQRDQPNNMASLSEVDNSSTNGESPSFGEHKFFQCLVCTKAFHSQQGLAAHMVSHEGNTLNLFRCPLCSRDCGDSQALNLHILLNHPDVDVIRDNLSIPQNNNS